MTRRAWKLGGGLVIAGAWLLGATPTLAAPGEGKGPPLHGDEEKTLYALGAILGQRIAAFHLSPEEVAIVQRGMADEARGATLAVNLEEYGPKVKDLALAREEAQGKAFREKAAREPGANVSESGLIFRSLSPGGANAARPSASDTVKVDYEGKLINGKVFDSSIARGEPISFALSKVIPCWTEGVQKMRVGEKALLICPAKIAYGDSGAGADIPPGATLVFEVHLLGIEGK